MAVCLRRAVWPSADDRAAGQQQPATGRYPALRPVGAGCLRTRDARPTATIRTGSPCYRLAGYPWKPRSPRVIHHARTRVGTGRRACGRSGFDQRIGHARRSCPATGRQLGGSDRAARHTGLARHWASAGCLPRHWGSAGIAGDIRPPIRQQFSGVLRLGLRPHPNPGTPIGNPYRCRASAPFLRSWIDPMVEIGEGTIMDQGPSRSIRCGGMAQGGEEVTSESGVVGEVGAG